MIFGYWFMIVTYTPLFMSGNIWEYNHLYSSTIEKGVWWWYVQYDTNIYIYILVYMANVVHNHLSLKHK